MLSKTFTLYYNCSRIETYKSTVAQNSMDLVPMRKYRQSSHFFVTEKCVFLWKEQHACFPYTSSES